MLQKILKHNELKFILAFIISVLSFLIIIFSLAIIIDPYNDFGTGLIKPLVMTNRTDKVEKLKNISPKPKIIIFGSSRMFSINPELIKNITGKETFNASVSFARPEDYWSMLNFIVNDTNLKPDMLIIGFNLGAFNNDPVEPQLINNNDLNKYLINLDSETKIKTIIKSFKEAINADYLRDIFVSLFRINLNLDRKGGRGKFLPNGQIILPEKFYFDKTKILRTYPTVYRLFKEQENLNPLRKLYLENTIAFANQNNMKVKLILLPMPNEILEKLKEETPYSKLYKNMLTYIEELATAFQFEFFDYSEIEKFNGLPDDFSDATHPGIKNTDIITKSIFNL